MKLNETKEIRPLFNYLIVRPFDINPYKNRISESGILTSATFGEGSFDNPDTGERDTLDKRITYGIVMEVGPEVKHTEIGDEVYYDRNSAYPLPILDLGFHRINEQNLIAQIRGEGDAIAEAFEFERKIAEEIQANNEKLEKERFANKLGVSTGIIS